MMTLEETYSYMYDSLLKYYQETHDNELGAMLGGFECIHGEKPFDPAAWNDWKRAIVSVNREETYSRSDTLQAIRILLKEYDEHHGFNLKNVLDHFSLIESEQ